jgi:hypothetical protein
MAAVVGMLLLSTPSLAACGHYEKFGDPQLSIRVMDGSPELAVCTDITAAGIYLEVDDGQTLWQAEDGSSYLTIGTTIDGTSVETYFPTVVTLETEPISVGEEITAAIRDSHGVALTNDIEVGDDDMWVWGDGTRSTSPCPDDTE